jgi:hypothetical protein
MKWFKHDADANMDGKLQEVLLDYGLEGYGLYWYCVEIICGRVSADNITFELEHDARVIARNTGSTPAKVSEMMAAFVRLGLFEKTVSDGVSCKKLGKRLDKSMTNSKVMRELIDKIKSDNVMTASDNVMTNDVNVMTSSGQVMLDKNRIEYKDLILSDSDESNQQQNPPKKRNQDKPLTLK